MSLKRPAAGGESSKQGSFYYLKRMSVSKKRQFVSITIFKKGVLNMKGKKVRKWLTSKKVVTSCAAVALAAVIGGVSLFSGTGEAPEFPSYTDPVMVTSIQEEETPLASQPKTTTKTTKSTKTTKKKVKLKKASTKSYTKKLKTKTKITRENSETATAKIATKKTVVTNTTEKYTKKSKTKLVIAKITTTVQTTTTQQVTIANETAASTTSSGTATAAATSVSQNKTGKYETNITAVAGKMDSRVLSAYRKLGFKIYVDSSVNYSGYFDARSRSITMRQEDDSVYHELGHFLAFIAGNVDKTSGFQSIYTAEKEKVTSFNKAYVTQNSSEYFAESVKDFILNNNALKNARPQTYAAVESALNQITDAQIAKIEKIYGPFWK